MCLWGYLSTEVSFISECYSAVTGWDFDLSEILTIGERIANMRISFNLREGMSPIKLNYPNIALGVQPLKEGPTKNITVDLNQITKEFFEEMNWDLETGKPSRSKFKELT